MNSTRSITYIAAGVLALLVAGAVVVLLAGARSPTAFPADSPQAAMQRYLAAWDDRDYATAYGLFSSRVQERGSLAAFERAAKSGGVGGSPDITQAVLIDGAEIDGNEATVHLTVEERYRDELTIDTFRSPREVLLVREDGSWKIDQPLLGVLVIAFGDDI
jgi:predicted lipid-binding transport protein (Tim44 family)